MMEYVKNEFFECLVDYGDDGLSEEIDTRSYSFQLEARTAELHAALEEIAFLKEQLAIFTRKFLEEHRKLLSLKANKLTDINIIQTN